MRLAQNRDNGNWPSTENAAMPLRHRFCIGIGAGFALAICGISAAGAQGVTLQPIPAAECQKFASQIQDAVGFPMKATEDDFTDLTDGSDGRSCHISGSASDQALAGPGELTAKLGKLFGDWRDDPARAVDGPAGAEKGYTSGNRIATIQVSWEPGPGVVCSDKQPLSACKILPQQKLWTAVVDIIEKSGK
jgi:hypothetical protein